MKVPFFRYPHVFGQQRAELLAAMERVCTAGGFILQRDLRDFEDRLAEFTGARHAIGVANASDALEMILKLAGVGPGDEVILPSHTFIASAAAVVTNGGIPILAEVGDDFLMDPADIEHRITPRTKAIMPTQLNGRTADMDVIAEIARRRGIALLEDSAQGLGSRFKGRMAGTFGLAGVYSFYPAKTLGCFGDGGAIVTNDDALATAARQLRDHGRDDVTGELARWGRNSRLDNLQAAVLLVKMNRLDEEIELRRSLARRYDQNLRDLTNLALPPAPDDGANPVHFDSYQNYEIKAEARDELRAHLAEKSVGTILQWGGKGVHQHDALGFDCHLPRTDALFERELLLPMNTSLTLDEVDYVCEHIRGFYAAARAGVLVGAS